MKKRRVLFWLFFFGIWLLLYVNNVVSINKIYKEKYVLEKELERIREENYLLLRKLKEIEAPERIIPYAREKLGLMEPDSLMWINETEKN